MKKVKRAVSLIFFLMVTFSGHSQDVSYLEQVEKDALVYPNPLVGQKFIVKSEIVISKVEVFNVIGKVINRTQNNNFDLREVQIFVGNCEKGMYFVKITYEDNRSIIKKLLVK